MKKAVEAGRAAFLAGRSARKNTTIKGQIGLVSQVYLTFLSKM